MEISEREEFDIFFAGYRIGSAVDEAHDSFGCIKYFKVRLNQFWLAILGITQQEYDDCGELIDELLIDPWMGTIRTFRNLEITRDIKYHFIPNRLDVKKERN